MEEAMTNKNTQLSVKYSNSMNAVPFHKFNQNELNLLFTICSNIKEKGTTEVEYSFDKLRELIQYEHRGIARFVKDLETTYDKLIQLPMKIGDDKNFVKFVLFTRYKVNGDTKTVNIKVNEDFAFVLNDLTSDFTRFELAEFVELKSTYSKNLYRLLKQYRRTGFYKISIDEFKYLLDIPESYRMTNIDQTVLKPAIKELKPHFNNLKIKKIKAKKGNKIEYLEFVFDNEGAHVDHAGNVSLVDENNNYYKKNIMHLNKDEIKKSFPDSHVESNQLAFEDLIIDNYEIEKIKSTEKNTTIKDVKEDVKVKSTEKKKWKFWK